MKTPLLAALAVVVGMGSPCLAAEPLPRSSPESQGVSSAALIEFIEMGEDAGDELLAKGAGLGGDRRFARAAAQLPEFGGAARLALLVEIELIEELNRGFAAVASFTHEKKVSVRCGYRP